MNRIVIIFVALIILYFLMTDNFADSSKPVCASVQPGKCTSKLCPSGCKIQKKKNDTCFCIDKPK